jgi:hypothetical protein
MFYLLLCIFQPTKYVLNQKIDHTTQFQLDYYTTMAKDHTTQK